MVKVYQSIITFVATVLIGGSAFAQTAIDAGDLKLAVGERDWTSDLVPLAAFAMVILIILINSVTRMRANQTKMEVLKLMVEKGQTIPPELLTSLTPAGRERDKKHSPTRRGIVFVAVGVGFLISTLGHPEHSSTYLAIGAAFLVGGIGFLVLARKERT
jgi:hypothetical protein